jgi:colicin import membrane protein
MTTPAEPHPPDGPATSRHGLINEARRHQRRRRQMIGAGLAIPIAISGLFVGLNLSDTGGQVAVVATPSGRHSAKWQMPQAKRETLPTVPSPSNVVVINPATGEVVEAQKSEAVAAALRAAQSAVAAKSARIAQAQGQIESAQAAAAAAAAAQAAAAAAAQAAAAAAAQPGSH